MPVSSIGENWYTYADNLPDLLEKKIRLMEQHRDDLPYIDPDFMWRMPDACPVPEERYLQSAKKDHQSMKTVDVK